MTMLRTLGICVLTSRYQISRRTQFVNKLLSLRILEVQCKIRRVSPNFASTVWWTNKQTCITKFVRKLVAEDSNSGAEAAGNVRRESSPDGHSISEVVESVSHDDHPGDRGHGLRSRMHMSVSVRMAVVYIFMFSARQTHIFLTPYFKFLNFVRSK